jgi:hypothetical protein
VPQATLFTVLGLAVVGGCRLGAHLCQGTWNQGGSLGGRTTPIALRVTLLLFAADADTTADLTHQVWAPPEEAVREGFAAAGGDGANDGAANVGVGERHACRHTPVTDRRTWTGGGSTCRGDGGIGEGQRSFNDRSTIAQRSGTHSGD